MDEKSPEDRMRKPAALRGRASVVGPVLFAILALLLSLAGAGLKGGGLARQAGQALDRSEGQLRPFLLSRQESGRIAHAPRPQPKPVLAADGVGLLPLLPESRAPERSSPAGGGALEAPRGWRPHLRPEPRAPPAIRLT